MQFTGQREDDVKVVSRKELLLPAVEPLAEALPATAGTGPMAAGVVPDLGDMALGTAAHVAPQHRRATRHHRLCCSPDASGQLVHLGLRCKARLQDPL